MRLAPLLLLLAGCSQIFGLTPPKRIADAPADDAGVDTVDAPDALVDIPDAAPGFCVTQADCPTSVCLPSTSTCASDSDVAWLSQTGTAGAPCTMAQPCSRLLDTLNTNKKYVRVTGTITNLSGVNQTISFFGSPGATFSGGFQANGGTVGLYDLALTGGGICLDVKGAAVTAEHVNVHNCSNGGVSYASGSLVLDGSVVTHCNGGGIAISAGNFVITNNFITDNGTTNSTVGGVGILVGMIQPTSRLDFNTIASNNVRPLGSDAGGVFCNSATFTGVGDVIVHNAVGGSTAVATANTGGGCVYTSSVIQVSDVLGFVSTAANDYHLTATSQLRDSPSVTTNLTTDVDGETRPYGAGYDLGADEYHP